MSSKPDLKVVDIYESNYREVVPTLRKIAQQIEDGEFGEVGCLSLVLLGDTLEVFAMGKDSDAPSAALVLHAGVNKLSNALLNHGT